MEPPAASLVPEPIVPAGRAPTQHHVDAGAAAQRGFARVIIFYGPPCSGKSEYFASKLAKDYTRVSASEEFRRNPTCSLHQVISNSLKLLEAGKNLVFDDCNEHRRTRESIVKEIRAKFPAIEFKCICFAPAGGLLQCQWANEWALAERAQYLSAKGNPMQECKSLYAPPDPTGLAMWFTPHKLPIKEEGFSYIEDISSPIYARISRPWANAALIVDVKTMFEFTRNEQLIPVARDWSCLRDWHQIAPSGRMILLVDEVDFFPMSLELLQDAPETLLAHVADFRDMLRRAVAKLAVEIQRPIYYLISEYAPQEARGSFFRPPNPGMIAWLQFRHGLDLANCLYLSTQSSSKLLPIPNAAGIPHVSANDFFAQSGWTVASKIRKYAVNTASHLPSFLSRIEFSPTLSRSTSVSSSATDNSVELSAEGKPLFKHFQRLCAEVHTAIPAEEELYSRRHGLFVPESISASLSPLTQWTMNDVRNAIDEDLLQEAEQYVLNARVIHRLINGTRLRAFLPTSEDDKHGVTVTYNIAEKCMPPRRECSCNAVFDCEHVVALLLAWVDDPSSFAPSKQAAEPVIPAAAAGAANSARKLPEWMDGSESQGDSKRPRTQDTEEEGIGGASSQPPLSPPEESLSAEFRGDNDL